MTEFNYLIYCPACKGDRDFLGGTEKATCLTCLREVNEPIRREREGIEGREIELSEQNAWKREKEEALAIDPQAEKLKLIKVKVKELFDLIGKL